MDAAERPRTEAQRDPLYNLLSVNILLFRGGSVLTLCAVVVFGWCLPAGAQSVPSEPMTFGGGRVTLGGDVSATFSCTDSVTAISRINDMSTTDGLIAERLMAGIVQCSPEVAAGLDAFLQQRSQRLEPTA